MKSIFVVCWDETGEWFLWKFYANILGEICMIIKPNIEKIVDIIVLFIVYVLLVIATVDLEISLLVSVFGIWGIYLLFVLRFWLESCRTLIMDEEGCTVKFLFIKKKYRWDELKVKRIEKYMHRYGYKSLPYNGSAVFSKKKIRKPKRMDPADYSMLVHPFSFFYVRFHSEKPLQKWTVYASPDYEVDEDEFRELMKKWNVELEEETEYDLFLLKQKK